MKIGILTFHRSINYGAFMQSFSLSNFLKKELPDCEVEIIDYDNLTMNNKYKIKFRKHYIKYPFLLYRDIKKRKAFLSSLKYLSLSDETIITNDCEKIYSYIEKKYDVVIVGSDAVWNFIQRGFPNAYVLNIKSDIKKLSYAASAYGMEMNYITEDVKKEFAKALESYSFIGVRDSYTENLIKTVYPQAEVTYTCDPTVFLDMEKIKELNPENYREYILKKYNIPNDKPIIGVMGIDSKIIDKIYHKYGNEYNVVAVHAYAKGVKYHLYDLTPIEWSQVFSLFELTVTNFFHGTLLSLKNYTPTISIDTVPFGEKNKGKIEDLLERMQLNDNFFLKKDVGDCSSLLSRIDYLLSNKQTEQQRIKDGFANIEGTKNLIIDKLISIGEEIK